MEIEDFRIGDIVLYDGNPCEVIILGGGKVGVKDAKGINTVTSKIDHFSGIDLTDEVFKKLGFKLYKEWESFHSYYMEKNHFAIEITAMSNTPGKNWYVQIDNRDCESVGGMDIQYVHNLQHFFREATETSWKIPLTLKEIPLNNQK